MSYVNIDTGLIHVEHEVTWENTVPFLATLREMDGSDGPNTITVHISSTGGTNAATIALCQAMRTCRKPVHTIGTGYIASAAVYLLAAGTPGHRSVVEGSLLMLHGAVIPVLKAGVETMTLAQLRDYVADVEARLSHLAQEVSRLTGQSADFWSERIGRGSDQFLTPEDALALGLADHIIRR